MSVLPRMGMSPECEICPARKDREMYRAAFAAAEMRIAVLESQVHELEHQNRMLHLVVGNETVGMLQKAYEFASEE